MLPSDHWQSRPGSPALTEAGSLRPEDSVSMASSQSSQSHRAPLSCSSSLHLAALNAPINSQLLAPINIGPIWTTARQAMFENRLARLTASAGLPLAWVDNIEWLLFLQDFLPAATPVSGKVLTTRVTPNLVNQMRNEAKDVVKGQHGTLQADGWTGENHRHIIAFMITANQKVSER